MYDQNGVSAHVEYRMAKRLAAAQQRRLVHEARGEPWERPLSSMARVRGWVAAVRHPRAASARVARARAGYSH